MRFKRILAVIIAALFIFPISGCSGDGLDEVIRYDIPDNPATLDPQQSDDPISDLIIGNMFMGLLKRNADGTLSEGVCSDYDVSDDGLVYRFRLRQDVWWVSCGNYERQCTADDFVYGFRRLFSPETEAPRAKDYFCIKNSGIMQKGMMTDYTRLGVKANSDFELEITLDYPNPRFPSMLCDPPAMPCCEDFFMRSRGKYGLSAEFTPSNGAFYMKSWYFDPYANEDTDVNHLILGRNYKNAESREICPSGLNFFIEDKSDFVSDFLKEEIQCIAVSNDVKKYLSGDYNVSEFRSITCGLIFNNDFPLFKNEDFRRALMLLADRDDIISAIPEFSGADGIVPRQVSMLDKSFREIAGECENLAYDAEKARELFAKARPELDANLFTGARIIVPDEASAAAVSYVMQEWQREFGFYCVLERLSSSEYQRRLERGDFEAAVAELSGKYDSPAAYLEKFVRGNAENYSDFYNYNYELLLSSAGKAAELSRSAEMYAEAERMLIDKAAFLPLYYKNEYFFTQKNVSDVFYDPFTRTIDFTKGKRK